MGKAKGKGKRPTATDATVPEPKQQRKQWTEEELREALEFKQRTGCSMREAAAHTGIPKSTLARYDSGEGGTAVAAAGHVAVGMRGGGGRGSRGRGRGLGGSGGRAAGAPSADNPGEGRSQRTRRRPARFASSDEDTEVSSPSDMGESDDTE